MINKIKSFIKKFEHYLLNLLLIWLAFLFYNNTNYYSNFLSSQTIKTIFILATSYTLFGLIYYIIIPSEKIKESKGSIIFKALARISKNAVHYIKNFNSPYKKPLRMEHHEKTAILFLIVKIFFLPLMLNFFYENLNYIKENISIFKDPISLLSINAFNTILFPVLVGMVFLIDTLWFSFGYSFEAGFLKNKIKSVEPTIIGWIVTLICYPPFNSIFNNYVDWYANDNIELSTLNLTFIIRLLLIFFLFVYLSATLALGTKCSNLTNRGIVTRGPYSIIRHPAYISKNLFWWVTIIPIISWPAVLSASAWSFIYYIRAVTEEKHLLKDPEYVEYCRKVKYRFIPFVI